MEFEKLAVEKCEDLEQQLFNVESDVKTLKTKVNNFIPEPYVPPVDPNKLPEIQFNGIEEGVIHQSADSIKLKIYDSFLFRTSMILNPVFFRADASSNVKLTIKFNGEFLVESSLMKFKVELNGTTVVLEENAGEMGNFDLTFSTGILTASESCGNKIILSFLGTSTTQLMLLKYIDIIVEGANVFFTTQVSDYQFSILNGNYEITKIDETGNGFYAVENASTFTGLENLTFTPTGFQAPYQEKFSAMMNFGNDYFPQYPYVLTYNFTGKLKIDSLGANPLIQKTKYELPNYYFFSTCYNYYSNDGLSIYSIYDGQSADIIYRHVINKKTGSNATNYCALPRGKEHTHITTTNIPFQDYSVNKNLCVITRSDGTNLLKPAFDTTNYATCFELGLGTNLTANFVESGNSNKFEVYMNVYGKIIKKVINRINYVFSIESETVVGKYKKYYKGIDNHYFAITHNNELKFY